MAWKENGPSKLNPRLGELDHLASRTYRVDTWLLHRYINMLLVSLLGNKNTCVLLGGGRECSGGCGIKTMTKTGKAPSCSPGTGSFRGRTVLSDHSLTIQDTSKGQFPGCHMPL